MSKNIAVSLTVPVSKGPFSFRSLRCDVSAFSLFFFFSQSPSWAKVSKELRNGDGVIRPIKK